MIAVVVDVKIGAFKGKLEFWKTWSWENWLIWKDPDAGKEKGTTEDEMVGWHHQLNGHEFEYTLGVGDGQGGLACCSSWGCKESDMTERLNWTELGAWQSPNTLWSSLEINGDINKCYFWMLHDKVGQNLENLHSNVLIFSKWSMHDGTKSIQRARSIRSSLIVLDST